MHAQRNAAMMQDEGRGDLTQTEFRLRYIENIIDDCMPTVIRNKCLACFNHVQGLYPGVIAMRDIEVGV